MKTRIISSMLTRLITGRGLTVLIVGSAVLLGSVVSAQPVEGAEASNAGATTYKIPGYIRSDCSENVTDAINSWLAGVPNGTATSPSIVEFKKNRCYRVDGTIGAADNQDPPGYKRSYLYFKGNGATIDGSFRTPPAYTNRAGIGLESSDHITIENFTIKGNHPNPCNLATPDGPCRDGGYAGAYEFHHGIALYGDDNVTIRNVTIQNVYGDGIYVGHDQVPESTNVLIENSTIDGTGRMGVAITSATNVTVRGVTFDRISYLVIDLEPEVRADSGITIEGNTIKRHYIMFVNAGTGISRDPATGMCILRNNYVIRNNVMEVASASAYPPLWFVSDPTCGANSGLTITGNTLLRPDGTAGPPAADNASIWISEWDGITIDDNRIVQGSTTVAPVRFFGTVSGVSMSRNDMRENPYFYSYQDINENSNFSVQGCGNITSAGIKPMPCP